MYEVRLTACTLAELREKAMLLVADLGLAIGSPIASAVPEVPLPEPKLPEGAPKRRGRPPKDQANSEVRQQEPETSTEAEDVNSGIPEHMRDDLAPASVEEALEELVEGVEPYQEGEEVPEDILERPTLQGEATETETAQPAEPEPDTPEPVTDASEPGADDSDFGPSAEAENDFPPELEAFIDQVESAGSWVEIKRAMAAFYNTETFKGFEPHRQNKIRASTWEVCSERRAEGSMRDLPDHAEDLSAFRLWLETQDDPDAIKGTHYTLQRAEQWKAAPDPMKDALNKAVSVRLGSLG